MDSVGGSKSEIGASQALLGEKIAARIRARGPMSFAEFMESALYHPDLGYYSTSQVRWGRDGDYMTTPQVHPAVGESIARLLGELDQALACPDPFTLIECGCGDGRLLQAVAGALHDRNQALWQRLQVVAVERGRDSRQRLEQSLLAPPKGVAFFAQLRDATAAKPWRGALISNELLDALPVERVRQRAGHLLQSQVHVEADRLVERFDRPLARAVQAHLRANEITLADGQVAELCTGVEPWFEAVATRLEAGAVLTIDYGHETSTLYDPSRFTGTLVCQQRFRLDDEPLTDVGHKDITSHVDFGNLRRVGRLHGFSDSELTTLRVFLLGLGAATAFEGAVGARLALRHLLVSEVGDRHRVLLQTRGLTGATPAFGRARLLDCAPEGPC